MTLLSDDPITQLSFSVYGNKGMYALLVGSGLSRSASIPTGWEITLDLIRRIASAQGIEDQQDWAKWYRTQFGKEPNYSEIVGELGLSRDERRSILHSYIEPNENDREEERKLPTKAHKAIARLVQEGYIKVIVTTNFDRLLENALREEGVEPTVIASVDALNGAEPLVHTSCYLLKLHGDYKDARILNTEEELAAYPAEYDALLDRIADEYGLIVCGWSGEWDHALRAVLLRARARRYPFFWAARGRLGNGANEIARQRDAKVIAITDGDSFFEGLEQRVVTLARTHRQNPLSVELLVNTTKRYLAKPEHRIQLDDLITSETRSLIGKLDN
ncbi:SIR2 family protein [Rhizobium laguerreae]|nr:SIR2 family protein [Rhizobium laguerreae]